MTANQLIALLFPVAGGATAIGAGLLAKWIWVDRPRRREAQLARGEGRFHVYTVEEERALIGKLNEADHLIREARSVIQRRPAP
jgi:hypothetical protein